MNCWASFHRKVAERGWTFKQSPAHFLVGGITGTILSIAPYHPERDLPPIAQEIVRVDDYQDESRDALLEAALRLYRKAGLG